MNEEDLFEATSACCGQREDVCRCDEDPSPTAEELLALDLQSLERDLEDVEAELWPMGSWS